MRFRRVGTLLAFTAVAVAGCASVAPSAGASIGYLSQFGSAGSGDGQFTLPYGVTIGPGNDVFVADLGNARVERFKPDGTFVSKWGTNGTGAGQFNGVFGVAFDASNNAYTTETANYRIDRFSPSATFELMLGRGVQDGTPVSQLCSSSCQAGVSGTAPGEFAEPAGLIVNSAGDLLVVNKQNSRIDRFSTNFAYLDTFGTPGSAEGNLNEPTAIAEDSAGNLYVSELANQRVSKFDSDGTFLMMWGWGVQDGSNVLQTCISGCQAGVGGSGDGQMDGPSGIAVDRATNTVWVSDTNNSRVERFNSSGAFIDKYGSPGTGDGQFSAPFAIVIDCNGAGYVADFMNNRIQRIGEPGTPLCMSSDPTPTPPPTPNPDATAPKLFGMSVSPKRFRVGGKTKRGLRLGCKRANAKKRKKCVVRKTKLKYELSEAATVSFTIDGVVKGRKVGKKCKRTTVKNKRKKRCTAYKRAASFSRSAKTGKTSESFTGKIGKRKLRPGNYRMTAIAKDAAGNSSAPAVTTFTVLRR